MFGARALPYFCPLTFARKGDLPMLYLIALVLPPLACLLKGRFIHFLVSAALCATVYGYPLAMIHAWALVKGGK